jgi:hypothetical protein
MRRVPACALWILLWGCSASGSGDDPSVVDNPNNGGAGATPIQPSQGGTTQVTPNQGGNGNIFDPDGCTNGCAFPVDPVLDVNVTAADIAVFAADPAQDQTGSFCVVEPQLSSGTAPGALFPRNWLRPRFRWVPPAGDTTTLWEIRLTNEDAPDPLRAYTRDTQWVMTQAIWEGMRDLTKPTTVAIRGVDASGTLRQVNGTFSIAPVDAGGSMVFWSTTSSYVTPTSSRLLGFSVGDDGVLPTLTATQVQTGGIPGEDGAVARGYYACGEGSTRPACTSSTDYSSCCDPTGFEFGQVECVGCHVSTPDGKAVIFTDNWPWNKVAASIEPGLAGALPDTVTPYAATVMKQPWLGMQALSPAHFTETERILVTSYGERGIPPTNPAVSPFTNAPPAKHGLAWFNLAAQDPDPDTAFPPVTELPSYGGPQGERQTDVGEGFGTAWGLLATGEAQNAVTPSWSNDGLDIAYVSTSVASTDGHPDWTANDADIKVVPYNNRLGGTAVPLAGASDPNFLEYYPEFSADDAFIAFARAPVPSAAGRCIPTQREDGSVQLCTNPPLGENPDGPYYNRNGEIHIVPKAGGTPIRLAANDPVSCTGDTSRGSINSWPRWSPRVESPDDGATKYYFLIFSSARSYPGEFLLEKARLTPEISNKSSQLYMAPIVVAPDGTVTTYPAIYLWNQNIIADGQGGATIQQSSNLTPAWDDFSIPEVPPIIQVPR